MLCPKCNNEMVKGKIVLRSSYKSRVLFSPESVQDSFTEKYIGGTIFDNKIKTGQFELVSSSSKNNERESFHCTTCNMFITFE